MGSNSRKTIQTVFTEARDKILIRESLAGNSKSFAKLISYCKEKVHALGMSFFHNHTDTEDFEQEVYLKIFTNLKSFRGDCKFSTWVLRIAYTTAINTKTRKKEYETIADENLLLSEDKTPEQYNLLNFTRQAVQEAVKELPENYSICLDLYFFYDLSLEEITVVTGFPLNTIKSHIFRAKKILAQKLA